MTVSINLSQDEADWLIACLGLVMQISRHWDNSVTQDYGNAVLAKTNLAILVAARGGVDPDEWLRDATSRLRTPAGDNAGNN